MRGQRLALFLVVFLFLAGSSSLWSQDASPEEDDALALDTVTVVSYRQPRKLSEVAGTVSVIGPSRIESELALDVRDMVRYEPGVEVDGGGTRFGFGGFRIRGIGGNRTTLVVDNVPVANRFSIGSFADSGRGLLELGLIERAEILRGPASTIYGSKALGGVVALSLIDADDLLLGTDQATRFDLSGATADDRLRATVASASRRNDWSGLLAATALRSGEFDAAARPATVSIDELDRDQRSILFRLTRQTESGPIRLTVDAVDDERESNLRALLGSGRFRNTTELIGKDRSQRIRLVLDQSLEQTAMWNRGQWRSWYQNSETQQDSYEARPLAATPTTLFRRFDFQEETFGFALDLEKDWNGWGIAHRLGYGIELQRSELRQQRDALETMLATGDSSSLVLGERFPLRDFPITELLELGAYLYDEIRFWPGGLMLSPGVRFEYYELDSQNDPLFSAAFPESSLTDLDTHAWAPRLGLIWPLREDTEFFAQFARAFRSPPFSDVNIGLDIAAFNIRAVPNPDLEPEQGRTLEAGVRWRNHRARAALTVFRNDFRDFISTRAFVGRDPDNGRLLFQSINRERVRIEGLELRSNLAMTEDFSINLSGEWTRGEDRVTGRSLPELSPPQAVASLRYTPSTDWNFSLFTTYTRDQRRLVDEQGDPLFSAPSSTLVDLLAQWRPWPSLSINAGLFNLGNEDSWSHANVIGRPADDPTIPLLADPGRSLRLSLRWEI